MNFLTQLGVLAVILIILVILIKSNQTLEKIYMEDQNKKEETPPEPEMPKLEMPKIEVPKVGFTWPFGKKSSKKAQKAAANNNWEEEKGREEDYRQEYRQQNVSQRKYDQKEYNQQAASQQEYGWKEYNQQENRWQHVGRRATVPMEKTEDFIIEILDDRGRAMDSRRVSSFPYTIGRNEENDLVLDDLSVSGYHASLEKEEGMIVLVDKGSLNKLVVNGRQETKIPISGEMEVGFGNTSLRFVKEMKRSSQTLYYAGTSLMEEWH